MKKKYYNEQGDAIYSREKDTYRRDPGVEKFLDGLEDSRIDPHLKIMLGEIDSGISASKYEKYLDRRNEDLAFELGISRESLRDFTTETENEFRFRLVNIERSRKARQWNSKINRISPSNEMESIIQRIETEKRNLAKLLTSGPLNDLPYPTLEVLPPVLTSNATSKCIEDYIFPEQDGFRTYRE